MASYFAHVLLFYVFRVFPINNKKIIFSNMMGKGYGDNAKYICNELLALNLFDIVWVVADETVTMPDGVRKIRLGSVKYVFENVTAKAWVDNCRKPDYTRKRRGQFYIQTWHGDIGSKKIEKEIISLLDANYIRQAKNDSKMIDICVSGNGLMTRKYLSSFWYTGSIVKCGYPRRDIFYENNIDLIDRVKKEIGIVGSYKVVLYAPTFRRNQKTADMEVYNIDWIRLLEALEKRFGGRWVGLLRLHPNISKLADKMLLPNHVLNVSDYPDMQELMLISDVCISDYSSSIYEFSITGKPGFIFAVDYENYKNTQDVFLSFDEIPFPCSYNNEELIYNILNFNFNKYKKENKIFYKNTYEPYQEGKASKYLADILVKKCFGG